MKLIIVVVLFNLYTLYEKVTKNNIYIELSKNKKDKLNSLDFNMYMGINKDSKLGEPILFTLNIDMNNSNMYIPNNLFKCDESINCKEIDKEFHEVDGKSVKRIEIFTTFDNSIKITEDIPISQNIYLLEEEGNNGIVSISFLNNIAKQLYVLNEDYLWGIDQLVTNLNEEDEFNIEYISLIFNYKKSKTIKFLKEEDEYTINWEPVIKKQPIKFKSSNTNDQTFFTIMASKDTINDIKAKFYDKDKNFIKNFDNYFQFLIENNKESLEFYDKELVDRNLEKFRFKRIESNEPGLSIKFNEGFYNNKMKILKITNDNKLINGFDLKKYSFSKNISFYIFFSVLFLLGVLIGVVLLILKKNRNKILEQFDYQKIEDL